WQLYCSLWRAASSLHSFSRSLAAASLCLIGPISPVQTRKPDGYCCALLGLCSAASLALSLVDESKTATDAHGPLPRASPEDAVRRSGSVPLPASPLCSCCWP